MPYGILAPSFSSLVRVLCHIMLHPGDCRWLVRLSKGFSRAISPAVVF